MATPSKTIGAPSIFVITTPRAFTMVPKKTMLSLSSSLSLSEAEISIVKGAITIDLMKVLLPSLGGSIFSQVFVLTIVLWSS